MKRFVFLVLVVTLVLPTTALLGMACDETSTSSVVDDLGRAVSLDKTPQRIVSLAPSCTEILFALGLGDKVVGVTENCDYPPEVKEKDTIGGFYTTDLEKVVKAEPDLILATSAHEAETIPSLESLGLTVIALAPTTLGDVVDNITMVGQLTDREKAASNLTESMNQRIQAITSQTESEEKPWVFFITWGDPLWTVGKDSPIHDIIIKAGGTNIAHDVKGNSSFELEKVVARNPEVIIACTGHGENMEDVPFDWAKDNAQLADTNARLNDNVYQIDANLINRPGPRMVQGLEWFAHFIHPELFDIPN